MLVVGTWVMAIGTCVMAYFIYRQYKQTKSQFEHMRLQSEKPVILDLIRYVIVPFLHNVSVEMSGSVWFSFRALGNPSEWRDSDRAKLAFDQFKERFPDAWKKVEEYDKFGGDFSNALEHLKKRVYETLLGSKPKLEEFIQRKGLQLNVEELAKNITEYNDSYDLCYNGPGYCDFYEENPDVAELLRKKLSIEIDEVKRCSELLVKAGRRLKERFEKLQKELLKKYDIPVNACSAQLERPAMASIIF